MPLRPPAGFIRPGFDPLKNPNAPTIGTATGGNASASVASTPPTNVGGSAISAYYAVSSPGQTTVAGAASPITVTGLTNGTPYTFNVWALNTYGPSALSTASNSVTPELPTFLADLYEATGASVATDSSSNIYTYIRSPTAGFAVVGKYNNAGTLQWQNLIARNNGGTNRTATDNSGNVLIVSGSGTTLSVVKLSSSGSILWQTEMSGWPSGCSGVSVKAAGVCSDSFGNVYVCAPVTTACLSVFAVIKLNSSGTLQFSRQVTGSFGFRSDFPCNIAVDNAGSIYIVGNRNGNNRIAIIVKLDSAGTLLWGRSIISPNGDSALSDVAVDTSGNVYAVGSYSVAPTQAYLVKYNSAGTLQWNRSFGISIATTATGIGLDSSGNIYISARYNNDYILAMVKYNSSGTIQWQRQLSAVASGWRIASAVDVQVDADGKPVFVSSFNNTTSTNNRVLIAKIPSDGSKTGTYTLSGIPWVYSASTGTSADVTDAEYTTDGFTSNAISLPSNPSSYTASPSGLTTGTVLL